MHYDLLLQPTARVNSILLLAAKRVARLTDAAMIAALRRPASETVH